MILAHRIQLDPTVAQKRYFVQACGTARFVWNWALTEWKNQYKSSQKPSAAKLRKQFNTIKYRKFPWMKNIHRDAHAQPFANLGSAFFRFFKKKAKHPKLKKRGQRDSFYAANDRIKIDEKRIQLPRVGWIRLTEKLRFSGKVMNATVSRVADRWFVSVCVEVGDYRKSRVQSGIVGVDLGVKNSITLSTGEKPLEGPKPLKNSLARMHRASRQHSRKKKGSNNRRKSALKLARLHMKIRNVRHDFLHKVTTMLCRENQAVGIEDLNVKGMMANRRLSRAISDIGFYGFRRQLKYKADIYRTRLVVADRWFPSSKMCSGCADRKGDLKLSDREYHCEKCGLTMDRDKNAAKNLESMCTEGFSGINACGDGGSGNPVMDCETTVSEAGTTTGVD